jgi:hypothetical protein
VSDRFDRAMADIAIKSSKNGGPQIQDVLTALRASHDDSIEVAERLSVTVESVADALHQEVLEAAEQRAVDINAAARLVRGELQEYREAQAARCTAEHKKLLDVALSQPPFARAPRRKTDPDVEDWGNAMGDADLSELRLWWHYLKWVVVAIGGAFLVAAGDQISHRLFGG